MSKLLITGGTGFWGKNFLAYIIENEHNLKLFEEIVILTRNSDKFLNSFPEFNHPKFKYINGDIRAFELEKNDINYILHLATDTNKEIIDKYPFQMIDVIINGTKNILNFAAKQTNLKKMIFASSGAVYGNIPENIKNVKETEFFNIDFTDIKTIYAQSKRTAEQLCIAHIEKMNLPIVIARGFSFFGKYLPNDAHFAINTFLNQAKKESKITIKSGGLATRSYLHSKDLAKILAILLKEKTKHTIYNIGSDDGKTLKDWALMIAQKMGNIEIEILNEPQEGFSAGNNYVPNIDRLKEIIDCDNLKKIF